MRLEAVLWALPVAMLLIAGGYLVAMFEGQLTYDSVVEALYYSTQTVTSVGYGNWDPTRVNFENIKDRIFRVKLLSIFTTLIGVGLFSMTVSALIEYAQRPRGG